MRSHPISSFALPVVLCLMSTACAQPPGRADATADATVTDTPAPQPDAATDASNDSPSTNDVAIDTPIERDVPVVPDSGPVTCPLEPACDAAPPTPSPMTSWRHTATRITVALGSARHRGRDLFLRAGEPQWLLAKFAYGVADDDIQDEDVEVFLLRNCSTWERIGVFATTNDNQHATVEDVQDTGGRIYVNLADTSTRPLEVGRHRVRFVVRGDLSVAEQYITVLPANARIAVSDVDGTLTESETAAFFTELGGPSPGANSGAPQALTALASRGYFIFYLTARPEWVGTRTQEWLRTNGFPPGIVHTTLTLTGAMGTAAETFKTAEMQALVRRLGRTLDYAFGNTDSDSAAYQNLNITPSQRYLYQFTGDHRGAQMLNDYNTLVPTFSALTPVCR